MRLNLPILDQVANSKSILIAGMGGGYDVFCGLPIYLTLREAGMNVHLANYSFVDVIGLPHFDRVAETCVGVTGIDVPFRGYFPEFHLCKWFESAFPGEKLTVWSFQKTGVRPLLQAYRALVEHLSIDAILLVDGGVDSLMRGDEGDVGTMVEDSISLVAVNELDNVPTKLIAAIAFGAEQDMAYGHVFENIAALTKVGAFRGVCSLTPDMPVYQLYEAALLHTQDVPGQDSSVINSSLVSAVRGEFGNFHLTDKTHGSRLWISPLMSLYWFFDLGQVAKRNFLYDDLLLSYAAMDGFRMFMQMRQRIPVRKSHHIPL